MVNRKRFIRWHRVSALYLIRMLLTCNNGVAFEMQRPALLKTAAAIRESQSGESAQEVNKWTIYLPRFKPYLKHIYMLNLNQRDKKNDVSKEENLLLEEDDVTDREYPNIPDQKSFRKLQRAVRTLPRRLPRFRRIRMHPRQDERSKVLQTTGTRTRNEEKIRPKIAEQPNAQNQASSGFISDKFSFREKRVRFSAAHQESRSINVSCDYRLLNEYMSRPISAFSIRSFHDHQGLNPSDRRNQNPAQRRRWLIRKLTINEAIHDGILNMDPEDDRYFRLAVPLMPLLGINLTPVIDFQVLSVQSTNQDDRNAVQLKSMRLSLLSKENEVHKAMGQNNYTKIGNPQPTKVSMNENIREIGNNAIEMAGKIEDIIKPYFSFEAVITWSDRLSPNADPTSTHAGSIIIDASTKASFLWNQNVVHPFVLEKISAVALKRAMKFGLQQLLSQLERDFKEWVRYPHN